MTIENIKVAYNKHTILESSTLKIESKGVTAILGRNGTGKSSVFNSIYGLVKTRDMAVSVNGITIRQPYTVKRLVNYIPQGQCHPSWLSVISLIKEYGLDSEVFLNKYPLFLPCKDLHLNELSHGTLRLLEILVSLHADVQYTILDEPFSSVMPVHNELIISTIDEVKIQKGILISDHQYRTVLQISDKLYLIHKNRIKLLENTSELVEFGYLRKDFLQD